MPRAIWSGTISFGLVSVPVKLYSAVRDRSVRFHQLHGSDNGRIQQKRFCALEERGRFPTGRSLQGLRDRLP